MVLPAGAYGPGGSVAPGPAMVRTRPSTGSAPAGSSSEIDIDTSNRSSSVVPAMTTSSTTKVCPGATSAGAVARKA